MKNIIIISLVIGCSVLTSCGHEPPKFNDKDKPFIVGEISLISPTRAIYYKNKITTQGSSVFGSWYEAVELPAGMYNVGDTIIIK